MFVFIFVVTFLYSRSLFLFCHVYWLQEFVFFIEKAHFILFFIHNYESNVIFVGFIYQKKIFVLRLRSFHFGILSSWNIRFNNYALNIQKYIETWILLYVCTQINIRTQNENHTCRSKTNFFFIKKLLHHVQNKLANEILRFLNGYDLIAAVILAY